MYSSIQQLICLVLLMAVPLTQAQAVASSTTFTSATTTSSTFSTSMAPWIRTIDLTTTTIITKVQPEVIYINSKDIITISDKPQTTATKDFNLRHWVSIKKDGLPKTIKPKLVNGHEIKNGGYTLIDYSTYFKVKETKTLNYEQMGKPKGMKPDDVHVEVAEINEDPDYEWDLNPIMRCIPKNFNKMNPKNKIAYKQDKNNKEFDTNVQLTSEPFCAPKENTVWTMGKTYFTHWYYKFFYDEVNEEFADKVKIHLTYISESIKDQGMNKRDVSLADGEQLSFWSSEWISNKQGFFPIYIDESFLKNADFEEKVLLTIQPDYMSDNDFHPLDAALNPVKLTIIRGTKISKHNGDYLEFKHWGTDKQHSKYGKGKTILEIIIIVPSVVFVAIIFMFIFVRLNKNNRDFSFVNKYKPSKLKKKINLKNFKNHKYAELPTHNNKPERHRL